MNKVTVGPIKSENSDAAKFSAIQTTTKYSIGADLLNIVLIKKFIEYIYD